MKPEKTGWYLVVQVINGQSALIKPGEKIDDTTELKLKGENWSLSAVDQIEKALREFQWKIDIEAAHETVNQTRCA